MDIHDCEISNTLNAVIRISHYIVYKLEYRVFNGRCSVLALLGVFCSRPTTVYLSPYTSSLTPSYRRLTAPDNGLCPHVVSCCPRKTVYAKILT